jgi:hypothetical protein
LERSDNPGSGNLKTKSTLKALDLCGNNPFRVQNKFWRRFPGLSLRSNPGLKLANAFGVKPN